MKEKQKAKELVDEFMMFSITTYGCSDEFNRNPCIVHNSMLTKSAKQCALICVDEIIRLLPPVEWELTEDEINELGITEEYKEYWQEVKQEIENL